MDSLTAWAQNNFKKVSSKTPRQADCQTSVHRAPILTKAFDWSFPDRDGQLVKQKSGRPDLLVFTERSTDKLEDLVRLEADTEICLAMTTEFLRVQFKYLIVEDWLVNFKKSADQSCEFHSRVIEKLRKRLTGLLGEDEPLLVQDGQCWSAAKSVFAGHSEQACRRDPIYRPFNGSIQVDLLDKSLYLNYAKSLLHESKHSLNGDYPPIGNLTEPVVILVDYEVTADQ